MRTDQSIPSQILDLIQADAMPAGTHLPAQLLADRLRVSRSPVNEALSLLAEKGVLMRQPNRGYFLVKPIENEARALAGELGLEESDVVTEVYFRIADDRLRGLLPDEFPEALLKQRYGLTPCS